MQLSIHGGHGLPKLDVQTLIAPETVNQPFCNSTVHEVRGLWCPAHLVPWPHQTHLHMQAALAQVQIAVVYHQQTLHVL